MKHQKNQNHKFGKLKKQSRIISDKISCKKCEELNCKEKQDNEKIIETNDIINAK